MSKQDHPAGGKGGRGTLALNQHLQVETVKASQGAGVKSVNTLSAATNGCSFIHQAEKSGLGDLITSG